MLSRRALNRALLSRQMLLQRANTPVIEAVERLIGMQAQSPSAPYFALWSRLADFEHGQLSRLLLERSVVRIVLMRGTLHLVSAGDCLVVRPAVQPVLDRWLRGTLSKKLHGVDLNELTSVARIYIEEEALTYHELTT
ncbi:crosslink repair DNA glycosylase YcaQ family protein [Paenibacillus sp. GYB004]|uniref:DNA glycosylase AlkZ-like family protein n=1 Tax=Paenibacillus sp. GYB004 TaxID=2994393 RepID=UPI002F969A64